MRVKYYLLLGLPTAAWLNAWGLLRDLTMGRRKCELVSSVATVRQRQKNRFFEICYRIQVRLISIHQALISYAECVWQAKAVCMCIRTKSYFVYLCFCFCLFVYHKFSSVICVYIKCFNSSRAKTRTSVGFKARVSMQKG